MTQRRVWQTMVSLLATSCGCSDRPSRVEGPDLSPGKVARQAIRRYDRNDDGQLTREELSPGLSALARRADVDSDGALTKSEIVERLKAHVEGRIGLQEVCGVVLMDGHPLPDATVSFVPDPVLEGVVEPASGKTDTKGFVELRIEGSDPSGVRPGFYQVRVSKKDASRREIVPPQYNSESELGEEIGVDTLPGSLVIRLSAR